MKKLLACLLLIGQIGAAAAQTGSPASGQPKLIVGVVVDQMRYDYLYRYYEQYAEGGFKRLMREGTNFTFAQYNYIPTYTGPGHASIYTGTTPYHHGIISNDWYDRVNRRRMYCAADDTCETVGAPNASGKMSPRNLLASTLGDELRMSNNGMSRVFGISIKDRGAILPGGRMANAAYWYDSQTGNFVSSTYYFPSKDLPRWVRDFNKRERPRVLMSAPWKLSEGADYQISMPDEGLGEGDPFGEGDTKFPHIFDKLSAEQKLDAIRTTPYGNELLADFALELLEKEKLGEGGAPDLLSISFSSPDYIGHVYGPNSMEVMDNYLKLDRQIARLLDTLDARLGKGNYLFFLTADHGVKPNGAYLQAHRIFNGTLSSTEVRDSLKAFCQQAYDAPGLIETVADNHIYLNQALIRSKALDAEDIEEDIVRYLRYTFPAMGAIFTRMELASQTPKRDMSSFTLNGFHHFRSGDITFELAVNHMTYEMSNGTSHGAPYPYDTHVPLLFFGWGVPAGSSNRLVYIEDIAPTIANLIGVQEPNGCIGVPLLPLTDE